MLYEGLKQNSTIVVVPSSAVESMNLGGMMGTTALSLELERRRERKVREHRPTAVRPAA